MKKLLLLSLLLAFSAGIAFSQLTVSLVTTPACNHDGTARATVTGGTGPYTYTWYTGGAGGGNPTPTSVDSVTGLAGGSVFVIVVDALGAQGYAQGFVTPPFTVTSSVINDDTCNQGLGSATVSVTGGAPPYSYAWSNSQTTQTATGLTPGSWDCSITDNNGCNLLLSDLDTGGIFIWNNATFTITGVQVSPSSCNDGKATVIISGGVAPFSYYWSSTPVQTADTAINLPVGSVNVIVTDATGCYTDTWAYINQGTPPFNVTAAITPESCTNANGAVALTVTGPTGPFTYLWSTSATTSAISGLSYGSYSCVITDINGCQFTKYAWVNRTTPITLAFSSTIASCGVSDGTATVTPTGGTGPYTYAWGNSNTTQTATGITGRSYIYVMVTDANGCTKHGYTWVGENLSCQVVITGKVVLDQNSNCIQNGGDNNSAYRPVLITPGGYTSTNGAGNYSYINYPNTYTITHTPHQFYSTVCPGAPGSIVVNATTAGSTYSGNNFYDGPVGVVNDLAVSTYAGPARPGFSHTLYIYYYNNGNTILNGNITVTHDAVPVYTGASPAASNYTIATREITWNLGPIMPGQYGAVYAYFSMPVSAQLGTTVTHNTVIDPVLNDSTPSNNSDVASRIVSASYDPNDKHCNFEGQVNATDTQLEYVINFQNTGNDTAFTVMVRDSLSSDLDISTLMPGVASHPYTWSLHGNGVIEFLFENIYLPDSNINEQESHGFVTFNIDARSGLALGTEIKNTAYIFFDYNEPVVTNTTNTILGMLPIGIVESLESGMVLFPNPASENFNISFGDQAGENKASVRVFDVFGKKVLEANSNVAANGTLDQAVNTQNLQSGIYMVEISRGSSSWTGKIVIRK